MFGYNVKQIAKGWARTLVKKEQALYESRISICRQCDLYNANHPIFGEVCDAKKCVDTNDNGEVCGCGCKLAAALRLENKKCVLNKW